MHRATLFCYYTWTKDSKLSLQNDYFFVLHIIESNMTFGRDARKSVAGPVDTLMYFTSVIAWNLRGKTPKLDNKNALGDGLAPCSAKAINSLDVEKQLLALSVETEVKENLQVQTIIIINNNQVWHEAKIRKLPWIAKMKWKVAREYLWMFRFYWYKSSTSNYVRQGVSFSQWCLRERRSRTFGLVKVTKVCTGQQHVNVYRKECQKPCTVRQSYDYHYARQNEHSNDEPSENPMSHFDQDRNYTF